MSPPRSARTRTLPSASAPAGLPQARARAARTTPRGLAPVRWRWIAAIVLLCASLPACMHDPARHPGAESARWASARQLVLVTVPGWDSDHGQLQRYARGSDGRWTPVGDAQAVVVGRSGSAWGRGLQAPRHDGPVKREGDGRSPAGVFAIGEAFGYGARADTALPYTAMDAGDYCIDVPASPLYNRIVDSREVGDAAVAGSTEPMRRDLHADGDGRYRLGFVIEHNADARPGAGSCIFAHVWKSPDTPTAGCTAMPDPAMATLLAWLDPAAHPVFVLLPQAEYRRLQRAWGLPAGAGGTEADAARATGAHAGPSTAVGRHAGELHAGELQAVETHAVDLHGDGPRASQAHGVGPEAAGRHAAALRAARRHAAATTFDGPTAGTAREIPH